MRIVYLRSARPGLRWFANYYTNVFPEGGPNAKQRFDAIEKLLLGNPFAGHKVGDGNIRLFSITKTPFGIFYRVADDRIEVIEVRDHRSGRLTKN